MGHDDGAEVRSQDIPLITEKPHRGRPRGLALERAGARDYLTLNWFPGVLDARYEEDEPVRTHPRDPRNRVDALPSSRHVQVFASGGTLPDGTPLTGALLAETRELVLVYETGLPVRGLEAIADHLTFYQERTVIVVDGEAV